MLSPESPVVLFTGRRRAPLIRTALLAWTLTACGGGNRDAANAIQRDSAQPSDATPVAELPKDLSALAVHPGARLAAVAVRRDTTTFGTGSAVATLTGGDTIVVSDSAVRVWSLGGSLLAFSGLDGAGGYENEGQSLTVVDVARGTRRRVVSDYFQIIRVEALQGDGRTALLVHMRDGGQGAVHVTVVDPRRGQVFRALNALGRVTGARILVAGYGDSETPVDFGDTRTPLRVDSLSVSVVDTMSLLVIPRSRAK